MDTKPWYQSKTIWGGSIAAIVSLLHLFGVEAGDLTTNAPDQILSFVGLLGSLFAVYGRYRARTKIQKSDVGGQKSVILIILLCLLIDLSFSGCGYLTPEQRAKATATGSYIAQKAASIALNTVVSAAINQADAQTKGNYLDSLATGLRTNAVASISSDDVRAIVKIWTPGDKQHWTDLAASIADLFESTRNVPEAQRVELIAEGLNAAAAKARAMNSTAAIVGRPFLAAAASGNACPTKS